MREITRSIGDVIGKSKILLNTIPISSCRFNIIDNVISIYHNGKDLAEFGLSVDLTSKQMHEITIVEFYNRLVLLSNNTYTVCNITNEDVVELIIKPMNIILTHISKQI